MSSTPSLATRESQPSHRLFQLLQTIWTDYTNLRFLTKLI